MSKNLSRMFTLSIAFFLAVNFLVIFGGDVASASTTVTYVIESSVDDAWTKTDTVRPDEVSLYLSRSDMRAGVRWQVNIPIGSTIEGAYIEVKSRGVSLSGPKCRITLVDQDSCAPFNTIFWDWDAPLSEMWDLPTFLLGGWHDSPDLKTLVQSYINRPSYQPNNYIGFILRYQNGAEPWHEVWAWDGDSASAAKLVVTYTPPPPFDFRVEASPASRTITAGDSTTYSVTSTLISGTTKAVSLSSSPSIAGVTYSFQPPSGNPTFSSTLTVQTGLNTPSGTYTLTITGTGGGNTHQAQVELVVNPPPPPVASFSYNPSSPVTNEIVTFDASASHSLNGSITEYSWDYGDGTPTALETDSVTYHSYAAAGTFNATLTVTDSNSFTDSISQGITVSPIQPPPVADFSFLPEHPLFNEIVTFDGSSSYDVDGSIVSYSWDFGDGNFGAGSAVEHSFDGFGDYLVTLTVTDNDGKTGQKSKYIPVAKNPIASFSHAPAYPIVSESVSFDASSSAPDGGFISIFAWNFGDGASKVETSPLTTHTYSVIGTYLVTLTVTDSEGLSDDTSRNITVVETPVSPPVASFTASPNAMTNSQVVFNATSSYDTDGYIVDYLWDFGDGNQTRATTATISHTYLLPGNYSVTLTVKDDDNISTSVTSQLKVSAFPIAAFTFSPSSLLIGDFVAFDASQSVANSQAVSLYTWNFGDGNITLVTTPFVVHRYQMDGSYQVTLSITNTDDLSDVESKSVVIHAKPAASFTFSPENPVAGQGILFDAQLSVDQDGTIARYSWAFGDGNTTLTYTPTVYHAYANDGNFIVVLTIVDNEGYDDSTSRSLQVAKAQVSPVTPSEEDVHDVAIETVHVFQTTVNISQILNTTVTITNQGTLPESFNVTLKYGMTEIGKLKVINLNPNASLTLTFWWNTTGFSPDHNRIWAMIEPVSHEADLSDNTKEGEIVELLIPDSSTSDILDPGGTTPLPFSFSRAIPFLIAAVVAVTCPIVFFAVKRRKNGGGKSNFGYLDKMLGGGIPAGSTIMVLGNPGAGKSILCQHLANQFLDESKACVFVSYDEPPSDVRKRMESFGWDLAKFEQNNTFSFVDCYSQIAKVTSPEKHYVDQPFSLTDLSITISTAMDEVKADNAKAVFLDSATSLFTKLDIQRVIRFLQDRSAKIKATGGIFIFTLGKETIAANFANRLEEAVDGIIELDFIDAQGKRTRKIRVKKLRGQNHLDQWVAFTINSKEGIIFLPHTHA